MRQGQTRTFYLCKLFAALSHTQVSVLVTVVHYSHGTSLLTQVSCGQTQTKTMLTHHDGGYDGKYCITERLQPFRTEHMLTQRHVESFWTIDQIICKTEILHVTRTCQGDSPTSAPRRWLPRSLEMLAPISPRLLSARSPYCGSFPRGTRRWW